MPPKTAAAASTMVRATLLKGSCSVRLHPLVWLWVRRARDFESFGPKGSTRRAHSIRPALSLAISMKWFIPMPQKNDRRGAKSSRARPASSPVRMYSSPSARV